MEVRTTRFGAPETVTVGDEALLVFPHGLPGFEHHVHFALLEEPAYLPFRWLQSLHDPEVAFILLDAFLVCPDYDFELSPADVTLLQLDEHALPRVYCILVVPRDIRQMTANLKAPVVLNPRRRLGKQVILPDDRYPLRYPVLAAQDARQAAGVR
ncbi:MAG TPA: flagellar assembly protein FliW [Chloroflexota bacterium]|jgi:flagellar assembly factor FliW|nr:flagellar assembly protein FliW [Chloroflexota bacterium]